MYFDLKNYTKVTKQFSAEFFNAIFPLKKENCSFSNQSVKMSYKKNNQPFHRSSIIPQNQICGRPTKSNNFGKSEHVIHIISKKRFCNWIWKKYSINFIKTRQFWRKILPNKSELKIGKIKRKKLKFYY